MAESLLICVSCQEVFTNEETGEHKTGTGHNHWTLLYGGASMFRLFKKWAIIKTEDYNQLVNEQEALKRKVLKQAGIIADQKTRIGELIERISRSKR